MPVVGRADTVGDEWTVMVHLVDAGVAVPAMDCSRRSINVAYVTVLEFHGVSLLSFEASEHQVVLVVAAIAFIMPGFLLRGDEAGVAGGCLEQEVEGH